MATQLKAFLSDQIRTLRGDLTQREFGDKIGKPQSVISRLEKQLDRHISIQTLIDIAVKLDIAVVIRFVDFTTFLRYTEDYSDKALAPPAYDQAAVYALAEEEERRTLRREIRAPVAGNLAVTAAVQNGLVQSPPVKSAEVFDLVPVIRQLQESRSVASRTLGSNAVDQTSGTLGSNAAASSYRAQETKEPTYA
jgi:transcriptional regulator with XRE-family HTH domain